MTAAGIENSSAKIFPKGAVAIAMYGATIGKTSILGIDAATNQACAVAIPKSDIVSSDFLWYMLRSLKSDFVAAGQGGAQPNISQTVLKKWPIRLPALAEQKRIVDKLDRLLAAVDSCKARLDAIPAILKRFRQSVLAAATSGALTEEEERYLGNDDCPYPHPASWSTVTLGSLSKLITSGSRGWADYYSDTGSLFIRSQNINQDHLSLYDIAHVSLPLDAEGRRTQVSINDLLITITGANVTRAARVDLDLEEAYVSQHVGLVRLFEPRNARFVHLVLCAEAAGRLQLKEFAYGGGKPGLNLQNLRDVLLALPPPEEQEVIVDRVNALFKMAEETESQVAEAYAQVDKLTQSLLGKAFRGEIFGTNRVSQSSEAAEPRMQSTDVGAIGDGPKVRRSMESRRA